MTIAEILKEGERLDRTATKGPWRWQGEDYRGGWGWQLLVGPDGEGLIVGQESDGTPCRRIRGFMPVDPAYCKTGLVAEGEEKVPAVHIQEHDAAFLIFARTALPRLLAVAKAGRTLAAAVAGTGSCAEELAAFDAAVRGEGKETTNG